MARLARVLVAGVAHHVIQRGNRRQKVFFKDSDREKYLNFLKANSEKYGFDIWAYCLMTNHVHLVVVPHENESLAKGLGETHKQYTRMINSREKWAGYLWEGRFKSFPLDEKYLYTVIRYVERNPVRAKLVKCADDYHWSSAKSHVDKISDPLIKKFYLMDEIDDWAKYLTDGSEIELETIRKYIETGRPLGREEFIERLEKKLDRILRIQKPGPKRNA